MAWRTPLGDRTLAGTEADLFIAAVQLLAEDLYIFGDNFDELGSQTGNPLFDTATTHQKLYLLNDCLSALLNRAIPPPPLTHILEAAVYLPFAYLKIRIEAEVETELEGNIDTDERLRYFFRSFVWKAYQDHVLSDWEAPDIEENFWEMESFDRRSTNLDYWEIIVEDLVHRILGKCERWKITAIDPSLADGAHDISIRLGITDDYLRNRIGIVTDDMARAAYREIHRWSINVPWTN
jgi:hypothetical protein